MNIGDRIKNTRKEKEISQKKLAEMLNNMPISTLANYENNHREPNIETLCRIADALDVSIDYLLGNSKYKNSNTGIMSEVFSNLIEKTDSSNYDFSNLVIDVINTMFITINGYVDDKNTTLLKNVYDLYTEIWNIKNIFDDVVFLKHIGMDIDNPDKKFQTHKEEINKLLDEYYKCLKNK